MKNTFYLLFACLFFLSLSANAQKVERKTSVANNKTAEMSSTQQGNQAVEKQTLYNNQQIADDAAEILEGINATSIDELLLKNYLYNKNMRFSKSYFIDLAEKTQAAIEMVNGLYNDGQVSLETVEQKDALYSQDLEVYNRIISYYEEKGWD